MGEKDEVGIFFGRGGRGGFESRKGSILESSVVESRIDNPHFDQVGREFPTLFCDFERMLSRRRRSSIFFLSK